MTGTYPTIEITDEMIAAAKRLVHTVQVNRTVASRIDTLTGILGEFVFAQYLTGNWRNHRVGANRGEVDFPDLEVKTSAYPFREDLNLLVREDYAAKRKPGFYVQIIIDVPVATASEIASGTKAYICGYASSEEVDKAPRKDFGSKVGRHGGYQCHHIQISALHPMNAFRSAYENLRHCESHRETTGERDDN